MSAAVGQNDAIRMLEFGAPEVVLDQVENDRPLGPLEEFAAGLRRYLGIAHETVPFGVDAGQRQAPAAAAAAAAVREDARELLQFDPAALVISQMGNPHILSRLAEFANSLSLHIQLAQQPEAAPEPVRSESNDAPQPEDVSSGRQEDENSREAAQPDGVASESVNRSSQAGNSARADQPDDVASAPQAATNPTDRDPVRPDEAPSGATDAESTTSKRAAAEDHQNSQKGEENAKGSDGLVDVAAAQESTMASVSTGNDLKDKKRNNEDVDVPDGKVHENNDGVTNESSMESATGQGLSKAESPNANDVQDHALGEHQNDDTEKTEASTEPKTDDNAPLQDEMKAPLAARAPADEAGDDEIRTRDDLGKCTTVETSDDSDDDSLPLAELKRKLDTKKDSPSPKKAKTSPKDVENQVHRTEGVSENADTPVARTANLQLPTQPPQPQHQVGLFGRLESLVSGRQLLGLAGSDSSSEPERPSVFQRMQAMIPARIPHPGMLFAHTSTTADSRRESSSRSIMDQFLDGNFGGDGNQRSALLADTENSVASTNSNGAGSKKRASENTPGSGQGKAKRRKKKEKKDIAKEEDLPALPVLVSSYPEATVPSGYKGKLAESKFPRSQGLTRQVLNEHLGELGLTTKSGQGVVSAKKGRLSHLTFNSQWNELPYTKEQRVQFWLGEGPCQLRNFAAVNPANNPNQRPFPIFWAQPAKANGGQMCHYIGHFVCVTFDTTQKCVLKGKRRQALLEFELVEFKKEMDEKVSKIVADNEATRGADGAAQAATVKSEDHGNAEATPVVSHQQVDFSAAQPQLEFAGEDVSDGNAASATSQDHVQQPHFAAQPQVEEISWPSPVWEEIRSSRGLVPRRRFDIEGF